MPECPQFTIYMYIAFERGNLNGADTYHLQFIKKRAVASGCHCDTKAIFREICRKIIDIALRPAPDRLGDYIEDLLSCHPIIITHLDIYWSVCRIGVDNARLTFLRQSATNRGSECL